MGKLGESILQAAQEVCRLGGIAQEEISRSNRAPSGRKIFAFF